VGVKGVALALLVRLYRTHGSLDEDVIAARLAGRDPGDPRPEARRPAGHPDDDEHGPPEGGR
jgi:hypothetical protein